MCYRVSLVFRELRLLQEEYTVDCPVIIACSQGSIELHILAIHSLAENSEDVFPKKVVVELS